MDRLGEVRAAEQRVREETLGAFAGEADVLEQALGLSLHVIHGARLTFDHTFLRALLVSRATGSLRCAWLAAAAGYRTQGLTLVRAAFEDYGTAGWVTMQPDDANLWLWEIVDDVPKPDQRPPRFTEIFKRLSEENLDSPDVLKDLCGRLS